MRSNLKPQEEEIIIDSGLNDLRQNIQGYTKIQIAQRVSFIKEVFDDFKYKNNAY